MPRVSDVPHHAMATPMRITTIRPQATRHPTDSELSTQSSRPQRGHLLIRRDDLDLQSVSSVARCGEPALGLSIVGTPASVLRVTQPPQAQVFHVALFLSIAGLLATIKRRAVRKGRPAVAGPLRQQKS